MRGLVCAILAVCATPAFAGAGGIAVLTSDGDARRDAVLVDALRIYTRDLGRAVRTGGPAPAALQTDAIARVVSDARRDGDDVVVWFTERNGEPVLVAVVAASGDLRETTAERDEPLRTARTLALKVRALLTTEAPREWSEPPEARAAREPPPASPAPSSTTPPSASNAPSASTTAPPSAAPPPAVPPSAAPGTPASNAATIRRTRRDDRVSRVELHAEYAVVVPTEPAWFRQGLVVRLAVSLGRRPLALFADAAFMTAPTNTVDASTITARVWPVGVGVALRRQRPRWQLTGGARASLQIVDADARAADGRVASARLYSAGLGLIGDVRWLITRNLGLVASLSAEALLPRLQLAAGGTGATDLGWLQFGATAGVVFSVP
jgi:hypothetical protein